MGLSLQDKHSYQYSWQTAVLYALNSDSHPGQKPVDNEQTLMLRVLFLNSCMFYVSVIKKLEFFGKKVKSSKQ